jgi:PIN domain nuclease of toxin-antitoxin system
VKLLLDTHALLWWLSDDPKLGEHARDLIADPANDILVSAASLWEILVKVRSGKLVADIEEILAEMRGQGFALLEIAPAHLVALATLPMHHRDPFDHLLIAQAIAEEATFLSEDGYTPRYPVPYLTCSSANPDPSRS